MKGSGFIGRAGSLGPPCLIFLFLLLAQLTPLAAADRISLNEIQASVADRSIQLSLVIFAEADFSIRVISNDGTYEAPKYASLADAMKASGCVAGSNGGFFSRQPFAPVGGMISGGVRTARVNQHSWMKGLLVVKNGRPDLIEADSIKTSDGFSDLLQSGTWLARARQAETDNSRVKIARRTFLGHDGRGRWVLGASTPCTLHELAVALRTAEVTAVIDLQIALNFDGGPSTGLWLKQAPADFYIHEGTPVRNFIGISPKSK